jgi:hypothetical protein
MKKLLKIAAAVILVPVLGVAIVAPEKVLKACCGVPPPVCPGSPSCPVN